MKAVYFAWVRERVGKAEEELEPPVDGHDGRRADRLAVRQGEGYAYAFEKPSTIRAALDRVHARHEAAIAGATRSRVFPAHDRGLAPMATVRVQRDDFDAGAEAAALARGRNGRRRGGDFRRLLPGRRRAAGGAGA